MMFPFDITKCDTIVTYFESNGAKWANINIRNGEQELNHEIRIYDDEDISEIQSLSENN